jgi:hypothetical protein
MLMTWIRRNIMNKYAVGLYAVVPTAISAISAYVLCAADFFQRSISFLP